MWKVKVPPFLYYENCLNIQIYSNIHQYNFQYKYLFGHSLMSNLLYKFIWIFVGVILLMQIHLDIPSCQKNYEYHTLLEPGDPHQIVPQATHKGGRWWQRQKSRALSFFLSRDFLESILMSRAEARTPDVCVKQKRHRYSEETGQQQTRWSSARLTFPELS